MTTVGSTAQNASIETLRALAVALVFVHHLHSGADITLPYFAQMGGWLGVQIFFVISGYLILLSARRYPGRTYALHRLLRIYPAYLLWFLVFAVLFDQLKPESLDGPALLAHLTFLQHLFPDAYVRYNALFVSWTLTIELMWYVVAWICAARFQQHAILITVVSMAASYAWTFLGLSYLVFPGSMDVQSRFFFVNNHFVNQLPFFFFGALVAVRDWRFDKAALACLFLVTVVLSSSWKAHFPDPIFISGFGVVALFLMLKDANYRNPRPVVLLSDISYSFYLVHYPVIVLTTKVTDDKALILVASLAVTLALSYLSYRFVEQPFVRLARRVSTARGAAPAARP